MTTNTAWITPDQRADVVSRLVELADRLDPAPTEVADVDAEVAALLKSSAMEQVLIEVTHADANDEAVSQALAVCDRVDILGDLRRLRTVLTASTTTATAIGLLSRVLAGLAPDADGPVALADLGRRLLGTPTGARPFIEALGPR